MYQALLTRRYFSSKIMPYLSIAAVGLCVWIVLITWSVMGGFLVMLLDLGRKMEGDVSIMWPTVGFAHYEELIERLEADGAIESAAPMIETFGLINLPDDRIKGVQIRGIDERFSKVSQFSESLWWKPLEKPMPKDKDGRDPRLKPDWAKQMAGHMRSDSEGFVAPKYALRNWDTLYKDGQRLEVFDPEAGIDKPALVTGIEMSGFARRKPEGWYQIDGAIGTRTASGKLIWQSQFVPSHAMTINVLPLDSKGRNFTVRSRRLPVANEFRSGIIDADKSQVYMNLAELQSMLSMDAGVKVQATGSDPYAITGEGKKEKPAGYVEIGPAPARVTTVVVKARAGVSQELLLERCADVYERFQQEFKDQVPVLVSRDEVQSPAMDAKGRVIKGISTWEQSQAMFIGAVKRETALVLFLLMGLSLVAVFLILAIFWSMVSEKTRDIGILRAVGGTKLGVAWLWLRYGLVIGMAGTFGGGGLAYITITYINPIHEWLGRVTGIVVWDPNVYYFSEIPNKVEPGKAAIVMVGGLLFSVLGALIPAIKAAYMDPVKALRFE